MQRVRGVYRKTDGARDLFVGAAGTEGLTIEDGGAGLDIEFGWHLNVR